MRATCETCGQVQPPDWQPGDLCTNCGQVVRREERCYWCVKLTPAGKYCRHCGAGQVPAADYGAARWLKHLGTDQFTIPKRLAEMDPEQVTHFLRLYQRHASVAERHLDDLAYAESFARQRGWVRALEDELLPRLPLPDDELQQLTLPPRRGTTDLEKLLEIRENTPFAPTRLLSALARLRQWQAGAADYEQEKMGPDLETGLKFLKDPDPATREETALTLSHWCFVLTFTVFQPWDVEAALRAATACPVAAATHLALMKARNQSKGQPVPAEALASADADLAFAAALASFAPEPLLAALRVPHRRYAAAVMLLKIPATFDLAALLPGFDWNEMDEIFRILTWQKQPRPDLRAYFLQAMAGQHQLSAAGLKAARELLVLDLRPGDAVRLVSEQPDYSFIAKVLQSPTLGPDEVAPVCEELIARDLFVPSQLSPLHDLIQANALPLSFVETSFGQAGPNSLPGLKQLIYQQIKTFGGPSLVALNQFLRRVKWDSSASAQQRNTADSLLQTLYSGDYATGRPELAFTEEAATSYYGSFRAFAEDFAYGLEHLDLLLALETGLRFLRPLEYLPADTAALLAALATLPPALLLRLRTALGQLLLADNLPWHTRQAGLTLLGLVRSQPRWHDDVQAQLRGLLGHNALLDEELTRLLAT